MCVQPLACTAPQGQQQTPRHMQWPWGNLLLLGGSSTYYPLTGSHTYCIQRGAFLSEVLDTEVSYLGKCD